MPKLEKIEKYVNNGMSELYFPFKNENLGDRNTNPSEMKEKAKKYLEECNKGGKLDKWIENNFKIHVHTEQEYSDKKVDAPTYLGYGGNESKDSINRLSAIINAIAEKKLKLGIIEVHSAKPGTYEQLNEDLNKILEVSEQSKQKIGIEYGRKGTIFTGENIEKVKDYFKNEKNKFGMIFDIGLCYQDMGFDEGKLINELKKNKDWIIQIHWNNYGKSGPHTHLALFDDGGLISSCTLCKIADIVLNNKIKSNLWEAGSEKIFTSSSHNLDFMKKVLSEEDKDYLESLIKQVCEEKELKTSSAPVINS